MPSDFTPGDAVAFAGMGLIFAALAVIAFRDWRAQRRAQRHLSEVLGHPARKHRATRDARVTEQVRT